MNVDFGKIFERSSITLVVLGTMSIILAALGGIPGTASIMQPIWQVIVASIGVILLGLGLYVTLREERAPSSKRKSKKGETILAHPEKAELSGLKNAFRIPVENALRGKRVKQMVEEEAKGRRSLRLLASSGYSYLNPNGPVWNDAKLGDKLVNGSMKMTAILESPFADFAITRAMANHLDTHQWQEKQKIENLLELLKYRNITLLVTEVPVNCSLFFTSDDVFYDPYLWPMKSGKRTENNFWVFEFTRTEDLDRDCYTILERHFDFCFEKSIRLEDFLFTPGMNEKQLYGQDFTNAYKSDPEKYLARYRARTEEFKKKMRQLLGWTT
jgi:hypothetical protein